VFPGVVAKRFFFGFWHKFCVCYEGIGEAVADTAVTAFAGFGAIVADYDYARFLAIEDNFAIGAGVEGDGFSCFVVVGDEAEVDKDVVGDVAVVADALVSEPGGGFFEGNFGIVFDVGFAWVGIGLVFLEGVDKFVGDTDYERAFLG
jgi:hypothetical protein